MRVMKGLRQLVVVISLTHCCRGHVTQQKGEVVPWARTRDNNMAARVHTRGKEMSHIHVCFIIMAHNEGAIKDTQKNTKSSNRYIGCFCWRKCNRIIDI